MIGHPFNPPHLIPLVEIVGGAKTSAETIHRVSDFYESLGKRPVRLHKEVPGHVANRLQAALSREVYHLIADGVVDAADADTALCWGPGLRWGIMGCMLTNHLGGGQGSIEHFFEQSTGPMPAWWKVLGQPVLTPDVQKKLIDSVHAEVGSRSIDALAAERDDMLLGLIELRTRSARAFAASRAAARVAWRRLAESPIGLNVRQIRPVVPGPLRAGRRATACHAGASSLHPPMRSDGKGLARPVQLTAASGQ